MKMLRKSVISLAAAVVTGVASADAKTVYVSPTGDDINGKGTEQEPYQTLEKGQSSCSDGDTLRLLDGTYSRTGQFSVGKRITLAGNPSDRKAVVINVGSTSENPYFGILVNKDDASVRDLVISNAYQTGNVYGAGLNCQNKAVISNCVFTCCQQVCASSSGGGALCLRSDAVAYDCLFTKNYASYRGGAVFLNDYASKVVNCAFEENSSGGPGGAVMGFAGQVIGCTFRRCTANQGGAIVINGNCFITNCLFESNQATSQGGAIQGGAALSVWNSRFYNNEAGGADSKLTWTSSSGGAVYCAGKNVTNVFQHCVFTNNVAGMSGMAICANSTGNGLSVEDCTFIDNGMPNWQNCGWQWGGGTVCCNGSGDLWCRVERSTFIGSYASAAGAVFLGNGVTLPDSVVRNCLFRGNKVSYRGPCSGAAITLCASTVADIENCTIVSGSGVVNPTIYVYQPTETLVRVRNCVFADNYVGSTKTDIPSTQEGLDLQYCVSETALPGDAETCHNRVMAMAEMKFVNPAEGNFQPKNNGSPLVNTGLNDASWMTGACDIRNDRKYPRIVGGVVDIGAWEYSPLPRRGFSVYLR